MKGRDLCCLVVVMQLTLAALSAVADEGTGALMTPPVAAESADAVDAWSADGGGGESAGGGFAVIAAIGQPDAARLSTGGLVADGGLWSGVVDLQAIFDDGFEDGNPGAWSSVTGSIR